MMKKAIALFALLVSASAFAQVSGNITTQNLNATGAATEGSCVTMDVRDKGAVSVGVQDTYTGALSAQRTTDGSTWETLTASTTFTDKAGTTTATIGSGTTGTFQLSGVTGFLKARICGLAAVTGSAKVTMQSSISGGSSGGGGGGGGGAITAASGSYASGALSAGSIASGAGVDGWSVPQGAKADAVCGTATGTCSEISLIKFLNQTVSASNAQLPTSLGQTTAAGSLSVVTASDATSIMAQGASTAGTKGTQIQCATTTSAPTYTTGTTNPCSTDTAGNLRVTTTFGSTGTDVAVAITRPNDTTAYLAGQIIGSSKASTAGITFTALCPLASKPIMITSAEFRIDSTALIGSEGAYTLYLYNVTPPSASVDGAGWDLASGDRASFLGSVNLGTPVDVGSTLYVAQDGINKQILCPASQNIFGYLVTVAGYTPAALRVYNITLHAVGL